jgi:hypothetical protein
MSRIIRRDMLKVMAATAAGAAVTGTGIESALAASTARTATPSPNPLQPATTAPKVRFTTTPGLTYMWLWGGTDFKTSNSGQAWINNYTATSQYALEPGGVAWSRPDLPTGAAITECWVSLIANDANPANIQIGEIFPWANSAPQRASLTTNGVAVATEQNLQMTIAAPIPIDNSQSSFTVVYIPGTINSLNHQIFGVRLGWINNPGLTLFPDPRRIVNGGFGTTTMTSGLTYGPISALTEFDGVTATGIPAGATAAFCAVQSYTPGVLTLFPDGATDPLIANYSGTGTQGASLNMVYMMVPLSAAGKFKIHSYITGKCYVDAWGYVF